MTTQELLGRYAKGERDFRGANLPGANLSRANLPGANLFDANLFDAYLSGANLTGANLTDANLTRANLSRANLFGANLTSANLTSANLTSACLPHFRICPEAGMIRVFKKLRGGTICELEVDAALVVCSLVGRKCRTGFAKVISGGGKSQHDASFEYKVGEYVNARDFDSDIRQECLGGIHFFMTRREAEEY